MAPSLVEKFSEMFPIKERDELADLEDMSLQELKLKEGFAHGVWKLGGKTVKLDIVDPDGDEHKATLEEDDLPEFRFTFSNDEDVYA